MSLNVYAPIVLGFIAGITVLFGVIFMILVGRRLSPKGVGFLNAFAGGVLAYLALEAGAEAADIVEGFIAWETIGELIIAFVVTSIALIGTWLFLVYVERGLKGYTGASSEKLMASIVAVALGLHNVGEGFAIAASLLAGLVGSAIVFTIGFAVHNFTEGFAIAGPFFLKPRGKPEIEKSLLMLLVILALAAGLPVIPGAMVYYSGITADIILATLYTIASASLVYALLHVNLAALAKLGGVTSPLFWTALFAGIAVTYTAETLVFLAM